MEIIVVYHLPSQTEGCQMPNKIRCFLCSDCWVFFGNYTKYLLNLSAGSVFSWATPVICHILQLKRWDSLFSRPLCSRAHLYVCLWIWPQILFFLFIYVQSSFLVLAVFHSMWDGKLKPFSHTRSLGRTRCGGSGYCCCKTKSRRFISMEIKPNRKFRNRNYAISIGFMHDVQRDKNMNAENEIKWMNRLRFDFFFFLKFYFISVHSSFMNTICLLKFIHTFSIFIWRSMQNWKHLILTWHGQYASH